MQTAPTCRPVLQSTGAGFPARHRRLFLFLQTGNPIAAAKTPMVRTKQTARRATAHRPRQARRASALPSIRSERKRRTRSSREKLGRFPGRLPRGRYRRSNFGRKKKAGSASMDRKRSGRTRRRRWLSKPLVGPCGAASGAVCSMISWRTIWRTKR